jgi:hypothetical protein
VPFQVIRIYAGRVIRGEFGQEWIAGEIVAQRDEERLDGDFRTLEQLSPGDAGGCG